MKSVLTAVVLASTTTIYMPEGRPLPRIEAITDRGPILEMIVQCRKGTAIMSYSKIENVYCGPRGGCTKDRDAIIARLCA